MIRPTDTKPAKTIHMSSSVNKQKLVEKSSVMKFLHEIQEARKTAEQTNTPYSEYMAAKASTNVTPDEGPAVN